MVRSYTKKNSPFTWNSNLTGQLAFAFAKSVHSSHMGAKALLGEFHSGPPSCRPALLLPPCALGCVVCAHACWGWGWGGCEAASSQPAFSCLFLSPPSTYVSTPSTQSYSTRRSPLSAGQAAGALLPIRLALPWGPQALDTVKNKDKEV